MEKDLLGNKGKGKLEPSALPREDSTRRSRYSATHGNAVSQWQFRNKERPQRFLSFATRQEGQSSKVSSSSFQPIPTPQRALDLDTNQLHRSQSTPQYASRTWLPYWNQRLGPDELQGGLRFGDTNLESCAAATGRLKLRPMRYSAAPDPIPSGSASTSLSPRTGEFADLYTARRDFQEQLPSKLTILYRDSVSVFDNVPLDKYEEMMSLAKNASSTQCTWSPNPTFEQPMEAITKSATFSGGLVISSKPKQTQKLDHVFEPIMLAPTVSTQNSSLVPRGPAGSSSMSAVINDNLTMGPPSDAPVTKAVMMSTAASNGSRARAASLARFLEKRKERLTASMPYPINAKSAELLPSNSSSTDLTLSSNNNQVSTSASNGSRARAASLARFLEERKERVIASMPYPTNAQSAELLTSKSSYTDLALSSNNNQVSTSASHGSRARATSLSRFLEERKESVITSMPYPTNAKPAEVLPSKSSFIDLTL